MTKLLEEALALVDRIPAEAQDELARALMAMAEVLDLDDIEPEHRAAVEEGLQQARRGEFASDEQVAEAFRRFER